MRRHTAKTANRAVDKREAGKNPPGKTKQEAAAKITSAWSVRSWTTVHMLVVFAFLGSLLAEMTPRWYARLTEQFRIELSEVTIEEGKEREWKLLPATTAGQREIGKTELLPPSRFDHGSRQLVLVAASTKGGYIKLLGQCKPSPLSGPWDLDCNGDWANVRNPNDELATILNHKAAPAEHGRFSVAFFKGGREGNITLMAAATQGMQPATVQKFVMVRGKKQLYE